MESVVFYLFIYFLVKRFLCSHSVWACSKLTDSPEFYLLTESSSIEAEYVEPFSVVQSPQKGSARDVEV